MHERILMYVSRLLELSWLVRWRVPKAHLRFLGKVEAHVGQCRRVQQAAHVGHEGRRAIVVLEIVREQVVKVKGVDVAAAEHQQRLVMYDDRRKEARCDAGALALLPLERLCMDGFGVSERHTRDAAGSPYRS